MERGDAYMENFYMFVIMSIFLIILPGPDTALVTKNTLTLGRTGGFKTMFGISCALLIHTSAAVAGLSAIIVKSSLLFSVLKYAGAVYLVYLGAKTLWALRNKNSTATAAELTAESKYGNKSCFRQGFLTNILNPKVAVFFLTFLPQFVDTKDNTFIPFLVMGITYTVLTIVWFLFYIHLVHQISAFMKRPKTRTVIEGMTGAVLIGFGLKLAIEKAHH
jgi:RhtB (resistance to homoserine/threonine) family protein